MTTVSRCAGQSTTGRVWAHLDINMLMARSLQRRLLTRLVADLERMAPRVRPTTAIDTL